MASSRTRLSFVAEGAKRHIRVAWWEESNGSFEKCGMYCCPSSLSPAMGSAACSVFVDISCVAFVAENEVACKLMERITDKSIIYTVEAEPIEFEDWHPLRVSRPLPGAIIGAVTTSMFDARHERMKPWLSLSVVAE